MLNSITTTQVMKQSDYKRMPWKNGLGETLEIYRLDDGDGLRFRISQAAVVEDGVFSDFSGLHRTLVLLSGDGMSLSHKNAQGDISKHNLSKPLDMARFSGGDETHATLDNGSIEDLNIMVREADTSANITACTAPCNLEMTDESDIFRALYANQDCSVQIDTQQPTNIKAGCLLIVKDNIKIQLQKGSGVMIKIAPL